MPDTTPGIKESLSPISSGVLRPGEPLIPTTHLRQRLSPTTTRFSRTPAATTFGAPGHRRLHRPDLGATSPSDLKPKQRLAASEAHYRQTIKSAAVGMALFSPDGRFHGSSTTPCAISSATTRRPSIHMTWQELTAPSEDLDTNVQNVREIPSGQADTYRTTKRYLHADGSRSGVTCRWAACAI